MTPWQWHASLSLTASPTWQPRRTAGLDLALTLPSPESSARPQAALTEEAIPLTIIPGLEYCSDGNALDNVMRHPECLLGGSNAADSRYLLLKSAQISLGFISHLLFKATLQNINLILAHPERYRDFSKNIQLLKELMDKGLILQFNADSFTGGFFRVRPPPDDSTDSSQPDQVIIASDAHDADWRPPILSCARKPIYSALGDDAGAKSLPESAHPRNKLNLSLPYVIARQTLKVDMVDIVDVVDSGYRI